MRKQSIVWILVLLVIFIVAGQRSYAQIDSRNQIRPDKEKSSTDPDKKKRTKRIKSKKDPRLSGKKLYSNKKQLKRNNRAKAKHIEKSYKGGRDISGRKFEAKRTPRETKARPQADPYKSRRIRTERSRAGPDAPEIRTATRKGERARTGDISGQKRVRQRSVRSVQSATYAQPNPYIGRTIRTEKSRAKSNTKQINSIRSATRPSESRAKSNNKQISNIRSASRPSESRSPGKKTVRSTPLSATAAPRVKQRKNVYRNHERKGGERSTDKDIAGRKLRTRNTRSAVPLAGGGGFSSVDPYSDRQAIREGERFRRSQSLPSSARSITRNAESSSTRRYDNYGQNKNRKSVRFSGVVSAKSVRTTSDPRRKGERPIYGNKYRPKSVRSISGYSVAKSRRSTTSPVSISGNRKSYRQRNTYQGKDRHFGENSSTKDIAGRTLRTRNYRSFNPTWAEFGGGIYGGGSAGKPTKKYESAGRGPSKAGWNNAGMPVLGKGRSASGVASSQFTGRTPISAMPNYGPGRASSYSGKLKAKNLGRYSGGNESLFSGNFKSRKRLQGGGSISKGWNNNGMPLLGKGPGANGESSFKGRTPLSAMPSYGPGKASSYSGRLKAKNIGKYSGGNESTYAGRIRAGKPLMGGGSITKGWNNNGMPLLGKGPGTYGEANFTGRMPLSAMPSYGPSKASSYSGRLKAKNIGKYSGGNESTYAGGMKSARPLVGGGSITKGWNNNGMPLLGKGPGVYGEANFTGRMPLSAMPSYGPSKSSTYTGQLKAKNLSKYSGGNESTFAGRKKASKPLLGGGSITRLWNNNNQPIEGMRNTKSIAASNYTGKMRSYKPLKGGGSITASWNNKGKPLEKAGRTPLTVAISSYSGDMPIYMMTNYGKGPEGIYGGSMKAKKPLKGGGGSITRHWNNNGQPLPRADIPKSHASLSSYQGTFKKRDDVGKSPGTERGRSRSLSFLRIGDPNHMGLNYHEDNLRHKNDLPNGLSYAEKQRQREAGGMDNGRSRSLSFLELGNPSQGGLREEYSNTKRKRDLPNEITGKNRLRLKEAEGLNNGKNYSFSFWTIGDPTRGGLVRSPNQAKGRLHPSSDYTKTGVSRNSVEEKDQPVKIKIWWAKLFKKNANQPDAVKEKVRRPRFDKDERSIWETAEREDWYKNK